MDHHGPVLRIVRPGVGQPKPLREVVIHLHGAQLPLPTNHILHHKINLRTVKRRFARLLTRLHT